MQITTHERSVANESWLKVIDHKVKLDHYRGLSVPFLMIPSNLEKALRAPIDALKDTFNNLKKKETRSEGFSKLAFRHVFSIAFALPSALYHLLAIAGNVFAMGLFSLIQILRLSREGVSESVRTIAWKSFAILTNANQMIRMTLAAIPFIGIFVGYAYDFTQVALLNCPGIQWAARKIDEYIHPDPNAFILSERNREISRRNEKNDKDKGRSVINSMSFIKKATLMIPIFLTRKQNVLYPLGQVRTWSDLIIQSKQHEEAHAAEKNCLSLQQNLMNLMADEYLEGGAWKK